MTEKTPKTKKKKETTKRINKKDKTKELSGDFAVIESGGKQYIVNTGRKIKIEKISGDHKEGDKITFDKVLLMDDGSKTNVGSPNLSGKKVEAKIVKIGRGKKITVIKYKQKSRYFVKKGHRQPFFEVEISSIK